MSNVIDITNRLPKRLSDNAQKIWGFWLAVDFRNMVADCIELRTAPSRIPQKKE